MSSLFKKLQSLKKKNLESHEKIHDNSQGQRDKQDAIPSTFPPSITQDPASQRTSQLLPLLVKPSPSHAEAKKKAQPQPQPLVLPELVQRQPLWAQQASSRANEKNARPISTDGSKDQTTFPKLTPKESLKRSVGKKKGPDYPVPIFPELSDEKFKYLWEGKKMPRGRTLKETLEMMDEREVLDTILDHLQPPPQQTPGVQRKSIGLPQDSAAPSPKAAVAVQQKTTKPPGQEKGIYGDRPSATGSSGLSYLYQQPATARQYPLYRYYGLKLRDSRNKDIVNEYVHLLLRLPLDEETDREGISEAIGVASYCHMSQILMVLRDFGHTVIARKAEVSENTGERNASVTVIICYGQLALGARPDDLLRFIELLVAEVLFQFHNTFKDEVVKKSLMKSVLMISRALLQSKREDISFPQKSEVAMCIILQETPGGERALVFMSYALVSHNHLVGHCEKRMLDEVGHSDEEVIEEEPLGSFSITVLHQAMITVSCITALRPPLQSEVRSELVGKSIKKVFCLPALKLTKLRAGSNTQPTQSQDFYHQTVNACLNMLTSLLAEAPSLEALQDILMHTNGWIDSPKNHERERAVRSTTFLLKYVSEHLNFDISQDFPLLGQLVALLALHIADTVKEIGQQSAEAMYHLHYIMMAKMAKEVAMRRKNRKGNVVKWFREDFFIPGPSVFYNNISKVAKAFGEHLTPSQITEVVLKAIDSLTEEDKIVTQAAGVLLSSFLEECGMDMEDLPVIVKEIYNHLPRIQDLATKEETLKAVCNLASKRLNAVVDILLECSLECDESAAEIWRALVADPYSNIKLIRPLLKRLQDEDPLSEVTYRRHSTSQMPIAATNALCLILSLPEASDALQNKYPHLLLALSTQIYFVLGTSKRGARRQSLAPDTSSRLSPLGTTVQALKNLIGCAGYVREYHLLGTQGCWELLSAPESFFEGIFLLARTLFTFSKVHLRMTFKQANAYLRRTDAMERTIGMAFFTELLFHSEIGLFFVKQDILDVLKEWMLQVNPLMQLFSIRGLCYMLQHPLEEESVDPFVQPLLSCASSPDKSVAKETIKCFQIMLLHLNPEEYNFAGSSLFPLLLKHFYDEDNELRIGSIRLFGMLLKGVREEYRNNVMDHAIQSLIPLIIQLPNPQSRETCQIALGIDATFLKLTELPVDIFEYGPQDRMYNKFSVICKYILGRYRQKLPEMLAQMVEYLKSKNPMHREAAAVLIACSAQFMKPDVVSSKQVDDVYLALRDLQGDTDGAVSNAAVAAVKELVRLCHGRFNTKFLSPRYLLS